jgi:cysteine desulfurase
MKEKILKPIYLDYNATTPLAREVQKIMITCLEVHFGNPSSAHYYGAEAKRILESARKQIALLINCKASEILFTSGGTESNNYAIAGYALANRDKGNHIITSRIEHPAVIEVCKYLSGKGFEITYVPVDKTGRVDPDSVADAITDQTLLITIMHANNEVGTIQPISEISKIAIQNNIAFHTDAAQSLGKIEVDVKNLGIDMLSLAGHKLYASKGIGALYVKEDIELFHLLQGAGQEKGVRPGTENIPGIAGLGKACELAGLNLAKNQLHFAARRDQLEAGLKRLFSDLVIMGNPQNRLPNTLNVCFSNVDKNFQAELFARVAASAGSACHSDVTTISPVLEAMRVPEELARGAIRFSTGKYTTETEIEETISIIEKNLKKP